MRIQRWLICLFAVAFVGFVGCNKSGPQAGGTTAEVDVLDASKFRPAFEGAPAETQAQVNKIMLAIGSSDYMGALSGIEALTNSAGITEPQKQVSADLARQIQKKLAAAPPSQ